MLGLKRRRGLACSFCGRSSRQVARLIAGPAVHICDGCVGVCNRILEGTRTPDSFTGWPSMSTDDLLGALRTADAAVAATRAVLQAQVDELRKREVSWEAIGTALGISRQAAWDRFA